MTTILALVGMHGSGKSAAAKYIKETYDFPTIRLGDLTERTLKEQKLDVTEENERFIREELRREHGMDVYAKLNMPLIKKAAKTSAIVVVDGLYSTEEYKHFLDIYGTDLIILAIYAPPKIRYARLSKRKIRPLTNTEAKNRDFAEIENSSKGGTIPMADLTIKNIGLFDFLKRELADIIDEINDD